VTLICEFVKFVSFLKFVAVQLEIFNRLWAHNTKSFRSGNCVSHSEQIDARVGRGFVVKAFAWIITKYKV
jgi:hypothetical protein